MNFEKTYCKATEENFNALIKMGMVHQLSSFNDITGSVLFRKDDIFRMEGKIFIWTGCDNHNHSVEVILLDGVFVKKNGRSLMLKKNNNKIINKTEKMLEHFGFLKPDFPISFYSVVEKTEGQKFIIGSIESGIFGITPVMWSIRSGCCYHSDGINLFEFELKKIAKKWYEEDSNFPVLLYSVSLEKYIFIGSSKEYFECVANDVCLIAGDKITKKLSENTMEANLMENINNGEKNGSK